MSRRWQRSRPTGRRRPAARPDPSTLGDYLLTIVKLGPRTTTLALALLACSTRE